MVVKSLSTMTDDADFLTRYKDDFSEAPRTGASESSKLLEGEDGVREAGMQVGRRE